MFSDMVFRMGCVWFASAQSSNSDVWMYRFDYETGAMRMSNLHSFHSSDLPFIFGNYRHTMARFMLLFARRKNILKISREMQKDFKDFMENGVCNWEKCSENNVPAKCYGLNTHIEDCMPRQLTELYGQTEFYRRSFSEDAKGLDL